MNKSLKSSTVVDSTTKKKILINNPEESLSNIDSSNNYKGDNQLLIAIILGVITFWLFANTLLNITPDIEKTLYITKPNLNLAVSITALFSGCFIVVLGGLADRFGRVKFTYIGFILSIVASLFLILATNQYIFIAGRALQGLSAACIMPATLALIKNYFTPEDQPRALSLWTIGSGGGAGLASFFGGAIATHIGWKAIFIISIVCAIIGMVLLRKTPESKENSSNHKKAPFDYSGMFFFIVTLISLNVLITQAKTLSSTLILILSSTLIIATIIFLIISLKKKTTAFIDFSLFKNKAYNGATLSNFILNATVGCFFIINIYIQKIGFSSFEAGIVTLGYLIPVLIMIRLGVKVLKEYGAKKPMVLGLSIATVGFCIMSCTFLENKTYLISAFLGFILVGIGYGLSFTPSVDTAISNSPYDKAGTAAGIYKMGSSVGNALGAAISTTIFTTLSTYGNISEAAKTGIFFNIGLSILCLISIILMIPKGKKTL